jgi:hypothetical protein
MKETPHLRELFKEGQDIIVKVFSNGENIEVPVFMRRPSPLDQQEAQRKGRASKARMKVRLSKGDEYDAVVQEVDEMSKSDICDRLMAFARSNFESAAHHEVLYKDGVGDDWSADGRDIMTISDAFYDRWNEIQQLNIAREEEELEPIQVDGDAELLRLQAVIDEFEEQVSLRAEELRADEKSNLMKLGRSELEQQLIKKTIDVEADLEFFQQYQLNMLYHTCRDPEDHSKPYFSSPEEIMEYPQMVRTQLQTAYDTQELGVDNLKNWLSLLNSSDSSE